MSVLIPPINCTSQQQSDALGSVELALYMPSTGLASLAVLAGNSERCFFLTDKWLNGRSVEQSVPDIYCLIDPFTRAKRTVVEAITDNNCTHDIN